MTFLPRYIQSEADVLCIGCDFLLTCYGFRALYLFMLNFFFQVNVFRSNYLSCCCGLYNQELQIYCVYHLAGSVCNICKPSYWFEAYVLFLLPFNYASEDYFISWSALLIRVLCKSFTYIQQAIPQTSGWFWSSLYHLYGTYFLWVNFIT